MKALSAIFVFSFATSSFAVESRPMAEMQGDCKSYKFDLSKPLNNKATPISSIGSSVAYMEVVDLPLDQWVELLLLEQDQVSFLEKPKKEFKKDGFGAMAAFKPKKSGKYYIAADNKVWIDFVDGKSKKSVEPAFFEMQPKCENIFKVIGYELKEGERYIVQLSSNPKGKIKIYMGSY